MAAGTSASARNEPARGRIQHPADGLRSPDDLRAAIDQLRAHAGALREALGGTGAGEERHPRPDAVPVPASLIDRLDAGIARVRAEIALLGADVAGRREDGTAAAARDADADDRDEAGMVALNMALNGASRAETDRYLAETFGTPDQRRIVDDAYERVRQLRGDTPSP